ncbi:MAG: hypothetical protein Q8S03_13020 [Brevundimonas sp.]|uniref:hypothetical protein n=1 Tax=Brevundimonas sp. TaxID=1871086 RepID=UPI0027340964|nr:hypothetical protein [Brevundimonas sp.]MDP3405610.1 hypothetical protein [Brevundimonas sp.]
MRLTMLVTVGLAAFVLAGCGQGGASTDAPSAPAAVAAAPEAGVPAVAPANGADAPSAPAAPQRATGYTPVPISAEDQPGRARQIRCQVGTDPETNCTFTPLFGDGSFQLDGPDIAYRMVISDGEGGLFAVFGPEDRVPVGGTYRRDKRDRACWIANEETPAPARICAR